MVWAGPWVDVSAEAATYSFTDGAGKALTTKTVRAILSLSLGNAEML